MGHSAHGLSRLSLVLQSSVCQSGAFTYFLFQRSRMPDTPLDAIPIQNAARSTKSGYVMNHAYAVIALCTLHPITDQRSLRTGSVSTTEWDTISPVSGFEICSPTQTSTFCQQVRLCAGFSPAMCASLGFSWDKREAMSNIEVHCSVHLFRSGETVTIVTVHGHYRVETFNFLIA